VALLTKTIIVLSDRLLNWP